MSSPPDITAANSRLGVSLMCCATVVLASMDAVTKILAGLFDPPQILLVRWAIFLALALALAGHAQGGVRRAAISRRPWLQVGRAVLLVVEIGVFIVAFGNLQLAEVIAIAASAPLIITALSVPVLGEKVGVHRWTSVAVGFVGVLIILRPGFGVVDPFHLLTLVGAVMWASYQLMTRLAGRRDSPEVSMFYLGAVGFAVLAAIAPFFWRPPTMTEWGLLLLAGGLGAVGHFLIIKALALAPASTVQPFTFLTFVWAIGLGWLVFDALPDGPTVLGALIIIASGLYVFHREHRKRAEPKEIPDPRDR